MKLSETDIARLQSELSFTTSRSSGKGGQHVNKTESRVQLYFDVHSSEVLNDSAKARIGEKAGNMLSGAGVLQMSCETSRSQAANKEEVIARFFEFLEAALKEETPRKKTKVPASEKRKRLRKKRKRSEKKDLRKPPDVGEA